MYAQTFVLSAAIRYMEMPNRERDPSFVYALIAASFLSYFGTVVSDIWRLFLYELIIRQVLLRFLHIPVESNTINLSWGHGELDLSSLPLDQFYRE